MGDILPQGIPSVGLFGSRGSIVSRPSQLDPDVPFSLHPAPDVLSFAFAHVDIVVAAFVNS